MRKPVVDVLAFCLVVAIMLQMAEFAAAAEVHPKLAQVVYLTASEFCECNLKHVRAGNRVVEKIFTGSRKGLLLYIDISTDMMNAETYLREYHIIFRDIPALLFLDTRGNLIWSQKGRLSSKEILNKLSEFSS